MTDTMTDERALKLLADVREVVDRQQSLWVDGWLRVEALDHIAARLAQTAGVPELSDEDIAAAISDTDRALDALPDRFSVSEDDGKRIIVKAVAESIRARLIAAAQKPEAT